MRVVLLRELVEEERLLRDVRGTLSALFIEGIDESGERDG